MHTSTFSAPSLNISTPPPHPNINIEDKDPGSRVSAGEHVHRVMNCYARCTVVHSHSLEGARSVSR